MVVPSSRFETLNGACDSRHHPYFEEGGGDNSHLQALKLRRLTQTSRSATPSLIPLTTTVYREEVRPGHLPQLRVCSVNRVIPPAWPPPPPWGYLPVGVSLGRERGSRQVGALEQVRAGWPVQPERLSRSVTIRSQHHGQKRGPGVGRFVWPS